MTSDGSEASEQVPQPPVEARAGALPSEGPLAAELRGFGPLGIISVLLVLLTANIFVGEILLPVGAVLVLIWVRLSRTPWREIGYVRPKSWAVTVGAGITFGIALKFTMKAIVMPLLGADPINHAYHYWAGNRAVLPAAVWACACAGFAEETMFRGYAFERLGKLPGPGVAAKPIIVLATSVWFGMEHYLVQGFTGAEHATIVGLVFGTIFAITGRVFMLMFAHAAFDLTALAMIYWNLESRVAHLVFR